MAWFHGRLIPEDGPLLAFTPGATPGGIVCHYGKYGGGLQENLLAWQGLPSKRLI
jgi:hypothetical protein